jgi:hypothetical protein
LLSDTYPYSAQFSETAVENTLPPLETERPVSDKNFFPVSKGFRVQHPYVLTVEP